MNRALLIIIIFLVGLLFSNNTEVLQNSSIKVDEGQNRKLIHKYYNKNKEFILVLKTGEKYKVSSVVSIDGDNYQFNILKKRLSGNIFYKNNISKKSDYKNGDQNSKMIIDVKLNEILLVESINYDRQIKEIRNYTFFILGMYLILSVFS